MKGTDKQKHIESKIRDMENQLKYYIKDINNSFSQVNKYKIINLYNHTERIAECKCKNDKFYLFRDNIICSDCFSEYSWEYNCHIEIIE